MSLQSLLYQIQGYRVSPMTRDEIAQVALPVAKQFGLTRRNRKKMALILEQISDIVTIDVLSRAEWKELTLDLSKGHFSPNELTIRIPEETYERACFGDKYALEVILHELGHMFLMHQAVLHKSDIPPADNESAEWQADMFAEIILESMGYQVKQLSLNFDTPDM